MTMNDFLKKCRERAGLSQEELAFKLNTSQSTISKVEKGRDPGFHIFKDWTRITNHSETGIAFLGEFLYGFDPTAILQTVMQVTGAA